MLPIVQLNYSAHANTEPLCDIGDKICTQMRKFTAVVERGLIKSAIRILSSTGAVLGAIEEASARAERCISERIDQLSSEFQAQEWMDEQHMPVFPGYHPLSFFVQS
ncbi:unnamed protein product [Gongylonema pulchrum]|uniref:Uncharacterized protein n=1 Tax=Gongylonema pulchrum TaxID=637853 RepID=A0A183EFF6_9BILA|nr:unnamed protein product [Gongylonema pulchrum]